MTVQHSNLSHSNIRTFSQHGFLPTTATGKSQVIGQCIFCGSGRKESFYLNVETKAWDCKICGKKGGFQAWLREIVTYSQGFFRGKVAKDLANKRGLEVATLKNAGIGFNPITNSYILPVMDAKNEKLHDIRIYKGKRLLSTAGCKVALYNWHKTNTSYSKIWILEGEWDGLAMIEALAKTNRSAELVLAVPGANTFKSEWASMFQDMQVTVLYDNDKAGRDGSVKVYNTLQSITRELKFIHWREKEKEGKDIRDVYQLLKKKIPAFFKHIQLKLQDLPQGADTSHIQINPGKQVFKFEGKGHTAQEVYNTYTNWLELETTDVLDVLYGTMIANRLPGDPLWLLLVAPSGSTKSEIIMSFDDVQNVTPISTLTPHTLISGASFAGGGDPSLIPKLDQKILTIKDLTNLLNMNPIQREEIFGQLRDAYDGKASKPFGNGLFRVYESKFGMICGVTPAIEMYTEGQTALGERFLRWSVNPPKTSKDEQRIILRAMRNTTQEDGMRDDLKKCATETLAYDYNRPPKINSNIETRIVNLAQWTATMRATIIREKYTRDVLHKPFKELATRLSKQYYKLLLGVGMFRRISEVTDVEYDILKHLAISTIPTKMKEFVRIMYTGGRERGWTTRTLSDRIRLPQAVCERTGEDLMMLGMINKHNPNKLKPEWVLSNSLLNMANESRLWSTANNHKTKTTIKRSKINVS